MQPPYAQQAYGQYPSTPSPNSGSGYPPHPGIGVFTPHQAETDFMTPGFVQRVSPSYNAAAAQSYTTQDIYRDQPAIRAGPEYSNDAYGGGSISGHGFNHAMAARSWGTPAPQYRPQSLQNCDYSMPSSIPYNNFRQGETYYAGYHSGTEQVPVPTMSFSPHLPGAAQNQDTPSEWRFHTCWVSHAEEDKIHLTIALKKS